MEKEQFIEWFHDAFEPYATSIMQQFLKIDGRFVQQDERLAHLAEGYRSLAEGQRLLRAGLQQLSRRLERVEVKALLRAQDRRIETSATELFALRVRVKRLEAVVFASA